MMHVHNSTKTQMYPHSCMALYVFQTFHFKNSRAISKYTGNLPSVSWSKKYWISDMCWILAGLRSSLVNHGSSIVHPPPFLKSTCKVQDICNSFIWAIRFSIDKTIKLIQKHFVWLNTHSPSLSALRNICKETKKERCYCMWSLHLLFLYSKETNILNCLMSIHTYIHTYNFFNDNYTVHRLWVSVVMLTL